MQTLQEAWQFAVRIRPELRIDLIVDGGPENVNHVVNGFVSGESINIHLKIALKDILFSNALLEAMNKTVKYRYLFRADLANGVALIKHMAFTAHDLNSVRPHGSLNGDLPDERYWELPVRDMTEQMKNARKARKEANRTMNCGKCL